MVQIAIENLLSTCKNRPLYEALWFLAFTNNFRQISLENESISEICNELIVRIRNENIDARSFLVTTNLVFGTVRLYKAQVDKLYDQTKYALQSCNSSFYQMNWLTQMTSTPMPTQIQKSQKSTQKSVVKKNKAVSKIHTESNSLIDDFEIIENVFKILDKNEDDILIPGTSRRDDTGYETAIDPTMARDVLAITMREPTTLMTSGFDTIQEYDIEEDFSDEMGEDFMTLLKETDDIASSQSDVFSTSSNFLTKSGASRKRYGTQVECSEVKKRRLTYMSCDETFGEPRNVNVDEQIQSFDVYDQTLHHPVDETSTFLGKLSLNNETNDNNNCRPSIWNMTSNLEPLDMDIDLTLPINMSNDNAQNNNTTLQNNLNSEPTLEENDATIVENAADQPTIPDSEFILEDISQKVVRRKILKTKSLVVDKHRSIPSDSVKKNIKLYKQKLTGASPFSDFMQRIHYYKSCTDVLFSSGSFRLQKSTMHFLYTRNMKKISEKMTKKTSKSASKENVSPTPKIRKSKRTTKSIESVKESTVIDQSDLEIPPITPMNFTSMEEPEIRGTKKLSKIKPLQERNRIQENLEDFEILPQSSIFLKSHNEIRPQNIDVELPMTFPNENLNVTNDQNEKGDCRKKIIINRLAYFWRNKDQSITMEKVCRGMQRTEAAGAFFELLSLSKHGVVELEQLSGSLEISHISCKISQKKLSKLCN